MTGGSYRGPVAPRRQRRAIRFVQVVLVLLAAGLLVFAGYSQGRSSGIETGRHADTLAPPKPPSATQTVVLGVLGVAALGGALLLQGPGVRIPTPARLDDLTGKAQTAFEHKADAVPAEEEMPAEKESSQA